MKKSGNNTVKSKEKLPPKKINMKYAYKKKKTEDDEEDGKFEVVDQAKQNQVCF